MYLSYFAVSLLWLPSLLSTRLGVAYAAYNSCSDLAQALPNKVFDSDDSEYGLSLASYFTQQEKQLLPSCIVRPTTVEDVATAVKILVSAFLNQGTKFAIRSGGHGINTGSANIEDGVTLDLSLLNSVEVNDDKDIASIGVGRRWVEVYDILESMGLTVSGGRDARVGVGGLVLGGGVSYFSPRRGFVVDDVVNFQVVLADGSIVDANADSNSDLFVALKGGGNNFGIVTRVDLNSFPSTQIWGGSIVYTSQSTSTVLDTFYSFLEANSNNDYDEFASLIVSYAFANGTSFPVTNPIYTKPEQNPPVYQGFASIEPQAANTMRLTNLSGMAIEQAAARENTRTVWVTTTFIPTRDYLSFVYSAWNESVSNLASVQGIFYSISFQPLPVAIMNKSFVGSRHGNSLGLENEEHDLILFLASPTWIQPEDDEFVFQEMRDFSNKIEDEAKRLELNHPFRYMNYAFPDADVIQGYGDVARERLNAASQKYDPDGIFQKAVPGGFKLQ